MHEELRVVVDADRANCSRRGSGVSGTARFHLRTLPTEDFPKLPTAGEARSVKVPAPARKALAQSALDNLKITTRGTELEIRTQVAAANLASVIK